MKPRTDRTPKSPSPEEETIASTAKKTAGRINEQRIDQTGLTSRVRGHVSARGKRVQAKRDNANRGDR